MPWRSRFTSNCDPHSAPPAGLGPHRLGRGASWVCPLGVPQRSAPSQGGGPHSAVFTPTRLRPCGGCAEQEKPSSPALPPPPSPPPLGCLLAKANKASDQANKASDHAKPVTQAGGNEQGLGVSPPKGTKGRCEVKASQARHPACPSPSTLTSRRGGPCKRVTPLHDPTGVGGRTQCCLCQPLGRRGQEVAGASLEKTPKGRGPQSPVRSWGLNWTSTAQGNQSRG